MRLTHPTPILNVWLFCNSDFELSNPNQPASHTLNPLPLADEAAVNAVILFTNIPSSSQGDQ